MSQQTTQIVLARGVNHSSILILPAEWGMYSFESGSSMLGRILSDSDSMLAQMEFRGPGRIYPLCATSWLDGYFGEWKCIAGRHEPCAECDWLQSSDDEKDPDPESIFREGWHLVLVFEYGRVSMEKIDA